MHRNLFIAFFLIVVDFVSTILIVDDIYSVFILITSINRSRKLILVSTLIWIIWRFSWLLNSRLQRKWIMIHVFELLFQLSTSIFSWLRIRYLKLHLLNRIIFLRSLWSLKAIFIAAPIFVTVVKRIRLGVVLNHIRRIW